MPIINLIEQDQMIPMLLEVCPSFQEAWNEHVTDYRADMVYPALGSFALHLLELHRAGQTDCFPAIGELIERFHVDGSPRTKEAATIGILESIQNVWSNNGDSPESFCRYLGDESHWYWQCLHDFWSGKVPYVGFRG